jgi:hypothetical protein
MFVCKQVCKYATEGNMSCCTRITVWYPCCNWLYSSTLIFSVNNTELSNIHEIIKNVSEKPVYSTEHAIQFLSTETQRDYFVSFLPSAAFNWNVFTTARHETKFNWNVFTTARHETKFWSLMQTHKTHMSLLQQTTDFVFRNMCDSPSRSVLLVAASYCSEQAMH